MKVNRISHIPYSHRVGQYHFQMVQAKLHAPVDPIVSYSLQPFYTREQQWMSELSDSLSRLYRYSSDLDKAAGQFDPERRDSAISARLAISSDPETATAEASSQAKTGTYRLKIIRLANVQTNAGNMKEGASPASVADVETPARDAEYILDGSLRYSSDNRITIGDGEVRVTMLRAGTDPVTITVAPDTERLLQQTRLLVSSYNRLQLFLQEQQETIATQKLETFERVAHAASGVLNAFGIRLLPNGQLELDDQTWLEAVQSRYGDFARAMMGLSKQFREETMRVQTMPLGAFSRPFDDAGARQPYSARSVSSLRYLHAASTGLFINLLF